VDVQAWVLEKGSKSPALRELPEPTPQAGEVLVEVEAVGLHPVDVETSAGGNALLLRSRPFVGGVDFVGTVLSSHEDLASGTRVYGYLGVPGQGAFAERLAVPRAMLAVAPPLAVETLATLPLPALCALQALDTWNIGVGATALVHGGAGGVGSVAVQLLAARGVEVVATAGASDAAWVLSLGATRVVDHRSVRFEDVVRDVDLVFDTVGGETLTRSFPIVKRGGAVTSLSALPPVEDMLSAGFSVPLPLRWLLPVATWWKGRAARAAGVRFAGQVTVPSGARLAEVARIGSERALRTRIDRVLGWTGLADGLAHLASGGVKGRVVVVRTR
jgi:NADPH:quinone reductase-like Zn-dependent oxidoreductase